MVRFARSPLDSGMRIRNAASPELEHIDLARALFSMCRPLQLLVGYA